MRDVTFTFKEFAVTDGRCGMKICTDGVIIGAWATCDGIRSAVDAGAGSALISLMVAQRSEAMIEAVEIDESAYMDACENIKHSPWHDRIRIVRQDINAYHPVRPVDLIISNPPFFSSGLQSPDSKRAEARHEGCLNYVTLIDFASAYLARDGRLAFIYDIGRDDDIIYKAEMCHLKLRRHCRLRQREGRPYIRSLYEFSPADGNIEYSELTINTQDGHLTEEFTALTKDFYL